MSNTSNSLNFERGVRVRVKPGRALAGEVGEVVAVRMRGPAFRDVAAVSVRLDRATRERPGRYAATTFAPDELELEVQSSG